MPRSALNRWQWDRKMSRLRDEPEAPPQADTARPVAAPAPKIHDDLPAIAPQHPGWISVQREWRYSNRKLETHWEVIYETKDEGLAMRIVNAQKYRTRAAGPGFPVYENRWDGKPVKDKGVLRHLLGKVGQVLCRPGLAKHDDDIDASCLKDSAQFSDFLKTICTGCRRKAEDEELI